MDKDVGVYLRAIKAANGFIIYEGSMYHGMQGEEYVARFETELRDILMERATAQVDALVEELT